MSERNEQEAKREIPESTDYEAPAIEQIVTPDGLDREVHYAGVFSA